MEVKRAKVHRLPTEDESCISKRFTDVLSYRKEPYSSDYNKYWTNQHLYITTDEEIKEGDWMMNLNGDAVYNYFGNGGHFEQWRKIIASTDPKLTKTKCTNCNGKGHVDKDGFRDCHCKTGEKNNLPQPSQAFIEKYCKQSGIDEVDVEYIINPTRHTHLKIKVDPIHNTITTHRIVEKMYNSMEVQEKIIQYITDMNPDRKVNQKLNPDWIKENL